MTDKFAVPMRMVQTTTVVVEVPDGGGRDAAADALDTPLSREVEAALDDKPPADWKFRGYETDFSSGIRPVDDAEPDVVLDADETGDGDGGGE